MMRKGKLRIAESGSHLAYCPGCKELHVIDKRWSFNGNYDAPTFSPSLLVTVPESHDQFYTPAERCHSYIHDGQWQFLSDCTHELAGKTVPMMGEEP